MTEAEKQQYKILIIDDDKFLQQMYGTKFKKEGFNAESMGSTVEALDRIKEGFTPDILLVDIILPTMTGLEFVKALREQKLCENTIIIMLTNQSESETIKEAQELGVEGYIVKATTIPSEVVKEVTEITEKNSKRKHA
tara:strand:- start:25 stop:438 length:414 start_codon:yes stop_codon:yes gene_type:complete